MKQLLLIGYEFVTVMVPAAAITLLFYFRRKRLRAPISRRYIVYLMIFFFYLFGVFYYTGAGTLFDARRYGLDFNTRRLNLIPFSDPDIDYIAYGLNIILFMPFGFLLPLIWSRFERFRCVWIAGASFSALIELSQLLNNRATDIDDLILNTIGAVLGAMLFKLFSCFGKCKPLISDGANFEAFVCIMVSFLCRFFFFDELGMAKIIFGF